MISALVLTFNEEIILDKCLKSLKFVDEIVVFDSYSTDKTVEIAKNNNARVIQREFDNYAAQRNAALKSISSDFEWVLMVDSDEIVSSELKSEILDLTKTQKEVHMFRCRRKDMFQDKWIKYSSGYPTWFPRLFKNGKVIVEREINEEYKTDGKISNLQGHLIHYPFNRGLNWWFSKHNIYSEMESSKMLEEISTPIKISAMFSKDPVIRRKFQKRLSYHIPFRPTFVFLVFYVFNLGFLDGLAGYNFCRMRFIYESMIDIKFKSKK